MASLAEVRARAIAAQAYADRIRQADAKDVREALRRLSCVQLDSISAVERSHRIVLSSRAGAYREGAVSELLRKGKAFEYWAHEACLVPIEDYPLFRRRIRERRMHVYVPAGVDSGSDSGSGTLLSPFDNLLWDRAFVRRAFAFDHVMEIYKKPHERKYGYYVLPFLYGDRLVARLDLKSDRENGVLLVRALHWEPTARTEAAEDALERALDRLARSLGLEQVGAPKKVSSSSARKPT